MSKNSNTLSPGRPSARSHKKATLAGLTQDDETKRVNFQLSAARHTKLKIHATRQGKSIKELLTEYIDSLPEG